MLEVADVTRTDHLGVRGLTFAVRPGLVLGLRLATANSSSARSGCARTKTRAATRLLGALASIASCGAVRGRRRRERRLVTYEFVSESIETLRLSPALE